MGENGQVAISDILGKYMEFNILRRYTSFIELNQSAEKGGVVFVGDSISEGFSIHELLRCDKPMYNRGIGGDTTDGVLAKLKGEVFDLEPSKVFLLIGTNDLGRGRKPEEVVCNIEEICVRIKTELPEAELYVESIYPINPTERANQSPFPAVGSRNNEDIQEVNHAIQNLASTKSFIYIDVYSKLIDEEGHLNPAYTYDGIHLNTNGYLVVKAVLQPYL